MLPYPHLAPYNTREESQHRRISADPKTRNVQHKKNAMTLLFIDFDFTRFTRPIRVVRESSHFRYFTKKTYFLQKYFWGLFLKEPGHIPDFENAHTISVGISYTNKLCNENGECRQIIWFRVIFDVTWHEKNIWIFLNGCNM